MSKVRVFLSHADVDKPTVRRLRDKLSEAGYDAWFDEDDILIGESIPQAIERGLREADYVIVCLSQGARASGWVAKELAATHMLAGHREGAILPVRLDSVEAPPLVATARHVDLFPESRFDEGVQALLEALAEWQTRRHGAPTGGGGGVGVVSRSGAGVPRPAPDADLPELFVRIERRGDNAHTSFHRADESIIATYSRSWHDLASAFAIASRLFSYAHDEVDTALASSVGHALFDAAFGPERIWSRVLQAVYRQDENARPKPIFAGVRLRIQSREPMVRVAPWRLTAWQGRRLTEHGWWISTGPESSESRDHVTSAPANVLMLGTDPAQVEALREVLSAAWGKEERLGYFRSLHIDVEHRGDGEIRQIVQEHHPDIVYLHLSGHPGLPNDVQALVLEEVFAARHRPQVMYLDVASQADTFNAIQRRSLNLPPLMIWRQAPHRSRNADLIPIYWMRRWLARGEEPVAALHAVIGEYFAHDLEAKTLVVQSDYRSWRTARPAARLQRSSASALHRLDRDNAKALVVRHIKELARSDVVRVMALVGYGAPGNHLDALCEQLRLELEVEAHREAALSWRLIEFPEDRRYLRRDLEHELRLQLGHSGSHSLRQILNAHASRAPGRARRVLWLDGGVFGRHPAYHPPLKSGQLADWICFASETLVTHCPADLRIVWYIAVETEEHEAMARAIIRLFERYSHAGFRIDDLHIGHVTERHLLNYLREHGGCPPNIEHELTDRILAATGGLFDQTVAVLDEASQGSWHAICERLRREQGIEVQTPEQDFEF